MIKEKTTLKTSVVLIVALLLIIFFLPVFKNDMQQRPLFEKLGYTPQGKFYEIILGEFRWFTGIYLSFKSIIYYGGNVEKVYHKRFKDLEYYNLYRTIKTSILLNPYNEDAYYFAQGAFAWDIGRIKEVNALLEYVSKYRTWDVNLPYFLGFNYAYFLKDFSKAAEYYKKASEISGSTIFTNLAARYFYEGGETELGIVYLKGMINMTRKEDIKQIYITRLISLEAIHTIEIAIDKFKEIFGKYPKDIQELVAQGILEKIPEDPYGGEFYIDANRKVRTTSKLTHKKEGKNGNSKDK